MGRIRTVKPELFRHLALFEAEEKYQLPLRITFVGLFTCCDRQGRFIWQPRRLKVDILPYDDIDISAVLNALLESGFIKAYEVKGVIYGCIPTWGAHQFVNTKEANSRLPDMTEGKILRAPITQSMLSVHARLSEENFGHVASEQNADHETAIPEKSPENTVPPTEIPPEESLMAANNLSLFDEDEPVFSRVPHASRTREALIGKEGKRKGKENTEETINNHPHCHAPPETLSKIFGHWQRVMNHPQAKLDKIRRRCIRDALAMGYEEAVLCQAIDGCALTPHNMGKNQQGQRYDGLHVIFKSADQIDRFIYNAKNPPRPSGQAEQRLHNNISAAQAWLQKTQHEGDNRWTNTIKTGLPN